jgi:outer membrane lipoprotein-sorting protein
MQRKNVALTAATGAAVGVVGLVALGLPVHAGAAPALPPIAPEELVRSVLAAGPTPLSATVRVDNELGLPALPVEGQAAGLLSNGTSQFQVWADGHGRERVAVPSPNGELTMINDGATVWRWDSVRRTVTESRHGQREPETTTADPATTARRIVDTLRQSSNVTVDGTSTVAGRDAYELVLTPKPTERTLLREVRIAVDAQNRIPLEVEVDTNGSSDPALKVGFSQLQMTSPDPTLFQFTPPPGAKVVQQSPETHRPAQPPSAPKIVGDGWDTVLVTQLPQPGNEPPNSRPRGGNRQPSDPRAMLDRIGTPISGPWGSGRLISTKTATVLVTSDGRVAVGAVPVQVLTAALGNA